MSPLTLSLLSLLLATPLEAHNPHDVVTTFVARGDFTSSGRAWLTMGETASLLLRSDDLGQHLSLIHI